MSEKVLFNTELSSTQNKGITTSGKFFMDSTSFTDTMSRLNCKRLAPFTICPVVCNRKQFIFNQTYCLCEREHTVS